MKDKSEKHQIFKNVIEQAQKETQEKRSLKSTKFVKEAEKEAKAEGETYAYLLLNELLPLLKSYFLGEFSCDDNLIFYRMPNGQAFKIFAVAEK